jgi:hypothetical protein
MYFHAHEVNTAIQREETEGWVGLLRKNNKKLIARLMEFPKGTYRVLVCYMHLGTHIGVVKPWEEPYSNDICILVPIVMSRKNEIGLAQGIRKLVKTCPAGERIRELGLALLQQVCIHFRHQLLYLFLSPVEPFRTHVCEVLTEMRVEFSAIDSGSFLELMEDYDNGCGWLYTKSNSSGKWEIRIHEGSNKPEFKFKLCPLKHVTTTEGLKPRNCDFLWDMTGEGIIIISAPSFADAE